jgi:DNA polymerase-3 subunit gamma/tau
LAAPTGNLNSGNLSINHLIEQNKTRTQTALADLPRNPFHKDDVIRWWKTIAHQQKLNGQDQVFHVMMKRDPIQLDELTFLIEVDNSIQLTRLESALPEILSLLRKEVKNYDLNISVEITNDAQEDEKFMTGNDRFEKMARKNSNLFDFKNRFNLDIEY